MTTTPRAIAVSVLFTLFGGPALVLLLLPWLITRFRMPAEESHWQTASALALIGLGLVPLFESTIRFIIVGRGTLVPALPTAHLVVTGLYRYVRNPMYVGVITALAGETLLLESWHMLEYLAIAWLIMHLFVCFYEEPKLARTYGEEYARFKRNVPRWIPRLKPWRGEPLSVSK